MGNQSKDKCHYMEDVENKTKNKDRENSVRLRTVKDAKREFAPINEGSN